MQVGDRVRAKSGGHFRQVGRVFEVYGDKVGVVFDDGAEDWFSDWDVAEQAPGPDTTGEKR